MLQNGVFNMHNLLQLKYRGEIKDRLGVWFGLKLVGLAAGTVLENKSAVFIFVLILYSLRDRCTFTTIFPCSIVKKSISHEGCGDSDGSIKGVFYMERCQANSVIFASIDELYLKGIYSMFKVFDRFFNS